MNRICGLRMPGRASFIIGGQWGSEGKGAAAAWVAETLNRDQPPPDFTIYTTNAGAQAGHTSVLGGPNPRKVVLFHLPTAAVVERLVSGHTGLIYLNAGSVIDPEVLKREVEEFWPGAPLAIHPMAAVITASDMGDSRSPGSQSERTAGVQKGVGHAIAAKVRRVGATAKDHPYLKQFVRRIDLNDAMAGGASVLVEVPQGISLSLSHSIFYPYTTSRDCTVMTAMADAGIHPRLYGKSLLVLRTFPIRVGNIVRDGNVVGESGPCYGDQQETTWESLGVEPEITTVSKRVRRVFTFSQMQAAWAMKLTQPDFILLTFCNYARSSMELESIIRSISEVTPHRPTWLYQQWGPQTSHVHETPMLL